MQASDLEKLRTASTQQLIEMLMKAKTQGGEKISFDTGNGREVRITYQPPPDDFEIFDGKAQDTNLDQTIKGPDAEGIYEAKYQQIKAGEYSIENFVYMLVCRDCKATGGVRPAGDNDNEVKEGKGTQVMIYDILRSPDDHAEDRFLAFGRCGCGYCIFLKYEERTLVRIANVQWEFKNAVGQRVYLKYAWKMGESVLFKQKDTHALWSLVWTDLHVGDLNRVKPVGLIEQKVADVCILEEERSITVLYFDGAVRKFTADQDSNFKHCPGFDPIQVRLLTIDGSELSWHGLFKFKNGPYMVTGMTRDGDPQRANRELSRHVLVPLSASQSSKSQQGPPTYCEKREDRVDGDMKCYAIERFVHKGCPDNYVIALSCHRYVHLIKRVESPSGDQFVFIVQNGDPLESDKRIGEGFFAKTGNTHYVYLFTVNKVVKMQLNIEN